MPDFSSAFSSGAGEFGLAGLGLSIFGGISAMNAAKQEKDISQEEVSNEIAQDATRQAAAHLSASRQQAQTLRNAQMQGALLRAAAVESGGSAQKGQQNSSFGGAMGTISGAAGQNELGVSQNLQEADRMFGLNYALDQLKIQMAGAQSNAATAQGIASLGGSLSSVGKIFGG